MGSIVFIIVIIAVVLSALNKQKQQSSQQKKTSDNGHYTSYNSGSGSSGQSYKGGTSYNQKNTASGAYAANRAVEHAKDNMSEQELKSRLDAKEFREMAGVEASDGAILSAAKMHSFATELSNEYDSKEDLMEPVWDFMVKGPDTSIPNERDFVSEGMDLINSYTVQ